ncbi:hypothetical protein DVH24_018617 [Malus domestica]|uniref:Uncharacterized protein n=1 Tax=Malus domestica TaxID=3750 RepID=A0A498HMZ0_MALDO|nr:hypothetical protein DVH24_018617 [Malus domestica]
MVLRASRPASRLTTVVEVLCYHGGHSDELEGGQALRWKMGREGGESKRGAVQSWRSYGVLDAEEPISVFWRPRV